MPRRCRVRSSGACAPWRRRHPLHHRRRRPLRQRLHCRRHPLAKLACRRPCAVPCASTKSMCPRSLDRVATAINSRWYDDRLDIYDDINIGVGTALGDKGLVVPVVGHVQTLSLLGIAKQLTDVISRARDGTLTPADMRGGTFTISNHGVSGSLFASPIIIAQPQAAILGVGKLEKRVVVREAGGVDTIQIRPLCYVSLTIDHRVVDGHQTNLWLSRFVEIIEGWPLED